MCSVLCVSVQCVLCVCAVRAIHLHCAACWLAWGTAQRLCWSADHRYVAAAAVAARDGLWCQLTAGKSTCMHCVVAGHVVDHISCSCSIAVAELDLSVCPQGVML